MRKKIMNETKYKYVDKTPSEIMNLEREELSRLRAKSIKDLTYEEIISRVGKRSVYSQDELKDYNGKNRVLLFIHSKKINKITKKELIDSNIIKAHPQSAQRLDEKNYVKLKKLMEE